MVRVPHPASDSSSAISNCRATLREAPLFSSPRSFLALDLDDRTDPRRNRIATSRPLLPKMPSMWLSDSQSKLPPRVPSSPEKFGSPRKKGVTKHDKMLTTTRL